MTSNFVYEERRGYLHCCWYVVRIMFDAVIKCEAEYYVGTWRLNVNDESE